VRQPQTQTTACIEGTATSGGMAPSSTGAKVATTRGASTCPERCFTRSSAPPTKRPNFARVTRSSVPPAKELRAYTCTSAGSLAVAAARSSWKDCACKRLRATACACARYVLERARRSKAWASEVETALSPPSKPYPPSPPSDFTCTRPQKSHVH
jgi:hypothetical protein